MRVGKVLDETIALDVARTITLPGRMELTGYLAGPVAVIIIPSGAFVCTGEILLSGTGGSFGKFSLLDGSPEIVAPHDAFTLVIGTDVHINVSITQAAPTGSTARIVVFAASNGG
jgi:hypothetical protein